MNDVALWVPDRCEIILLDCSSWAVGESPDHSPFLVLSPRSFNERTSHVIGLPLTNGYGNACSLEASPESTVRRDGNALAHYLPAPRPKSLNWRVRGAAPYAAGRVPDSFFANVCLVLNQII